MSAVEPLCLLFEIDSVTFSKEENYLLEAELFLLICDELKEILREQHQEYFQLMKFTMEEENTMLELKFVGFIIQDILSTKEYDIDGIAHYSDTHVDALNDACTGLNKYPSAILLRKIIEIHRTVRRELYQKIKQKLLQNINQ